MIELLDGANTGLDVYLEHKPGMDEEGLLIEGEMRAEYADYGY